MVQLKGVGSELAAVLPDDNVAWYRKKHLLRLNASIFCLIIVSSANGYDGSMMNGLQVLPQWQEFMSSPTGPWLGFVNAVLSPGQQTGLAERKRSSWHISGCFSDVDFRPEPKTQQCLFLEGFSWVALQRSLLQPHLCSSRKLRSPLIAPS
jgi:hypothetical protein